MIARLDEDVAPLGGDEDSRGQDERGGRQRDVAARDAREALG
jgi:hypothetical protein